MTRTEALKFLVGQLKELKEKNVADLMKAKRIDELWKISQQLKISPLLSFFNGKNRLNLKMHEIPQGFHYELAFYISQSGFCDFEIFEDYWQFIELLKSTQENLAEQIANIMIKNNLSDFTILELLDGKIDEKE